MSHGPSSSHGWSKIFKSPSSKSSTSSSATTSSLKNRNLGDHLFVDNPFHRPPSSASSYTSSTASEQTFRTGSSAGNRNLKPSSSSSLGYSPTMSSHDLDDEAECPVCLEPLSFSFRLPGEKPHVVPECGHALHEVSALFSPYRGFVC